MNIKELKNRSQSSILISLIITTVIIGGLIWTTLPLFGSPGFSKTQVASVEAQTNQPVASAKAASLMMNMRKLWVDHLIWLNMWVIDYAATGQDNSTISDRLNKNADDIGSAIRTYYGNDAGNKIASLLKDHVRLATDVVKASKANDSNALGSANTRWYDNANQIADFLAQTIPNISDTDLRQMMKTHLDQDKQAANDILSNNSQAIVTDFDNAENQILMMADTLSQGIMKQLPDRF